MKNEDKYYQAMLARDYRFDGKFFVGVKTTGIYCRPICPAKPKRENVEFFPNHLDAEKAGYRPCLRCRPESAPQSGAWMGKSAMVQRAIKMLNQSQTLSFSEDQFAEKFGVSARHLRRVFVEEVGKTPKQLAAENRLNLARKLVVETNLPMTQIVYASGFESIRRFNDAFKARFARAPSELRKKKLESLGGALAVTLSYRPPFDFKNLLKFYRNHGIAQLERFEENQMIRVISFGHEVGILKISDEPEFCRLKVEIDFPNTAYLHVILAKVRTMFDLDSDPVIVANSLEVDPGIKKLLKKYPGVRLPSGWDPFEVAISTILGQLVSVSSGRKLVGDLVEFLGEDSGLENQGKKIKLFPTPQMIAEADLSELKTTRRRKETLRAFAGAVSKGEVSLEATQSVEDFYSSLMGIKGIGPWTADYMALKVIRNADAFPKSDLIIARALSLHPLEKINLMSPWRGYVAVLLWLEYHNPTSGK
jgi:AraC family transcriptional regulator, regulatory protein of adaptative response / DNA-3-methyladenine glycosylase II